MREGRGEEQGNENPLQDATWLYSYADLMTQLLLFSILMLTVIGISLHPASGPAQKKSDAAAAVAALDGYVRAAGLEASVAVEKGADRVVVRLKSRLLFEEAQAALTPGAQEVLRGLAPILAQSGRALRVEGHTDDRPIRSARFPSNWELSSARAISVATFLEGQGIARSRLAVAGYGEHHPITPNVDEESRSLNRRVEIVLVGEK